VTGWPSAGALGAAALAVLLLAPAPARAADPAVPSHRLFTFQGDDVYESSGLVDRGRLVWTNNDSGDDAVLYGVDARTGRTVRRTTYASSVEDVEAIAPGRGGVIWAGDIGDNRADRHDVSVYRVTPGGSGAAPRYRLQYPDGPHNAEALLVQPRTQRVLVVSKSPFGGTVYAAPLPLREDTENRLRVFAHVAGLVTDGTFFPDGRHVLLRTYGTASVYTFPAFELVGTVTLPAQPQGEGISMSRTGRVLVSSEGADTDVLRVDLPRALSAPGSGTPPASTGPSPSTGGPPAVPAAPRPKRTLGDWLVSAAVAAVIAGLGYLTLRGSRLRGPRTR
jgi:hypothetical protein